MRLNYLILKKTNLKGCLMPCKKEFLSSKMVKLSSWMSSARKFWQLFQAWRAFREISSKQERNSKMSTQWIGSSFLFLKTTMNKLPLKKIKRRRKKQITRRRLQDPAKVQQTTTLRLNTQLMSFSNYLLLNSRQKCSLLIRRWQKI